MADIEISLIPGQRDLAEWVFVPGLGNADVFHVIETASIPGKYPKRLRVLLPAGPTCAGRAWGVLESDENSVGSALSDDAVAAVRYLAPGAVADVTRRSLNVCRRAVPLTSAWR